MTDAHGVARDQLRSYFDRWSRLEDEKAVIADDLKELFAEAKGLGFDSKALRIAFRAKVKQDAANPADLELEAIVDTYLEALGTSPRASRAYARENIEEFDPATGEIIDDRQDAIDRHGFESALSAVLGVDVEIVREDRSDGGLQIVHKHTDIRTSDGGPVPAGRPSLATRGSEESVVSNSETHQRPSNNDKPCLKAVPQDAPSPAGTGSELLAGREGRHEGEAAPADLPTYPPETATTQRVNGHSQHESGNAQAIVQNEVVTVVGTESGTVANPELDDVIYETVPPTPMKRLPYASCFPEVTGAAYERLGTDIAFKGIQEPIVRMGDVIVDGWARYNIARSLGIEYPVTPYRGDDVLLDVIRWQRAARNFTPAQEAKIAAALAKAVHHRADDIMAAFDLAPAEMAGAA